MLDSEWEPCVVRKNDGTLADAWTDWTITHLYARKENGRGRRVARTITNVVFRDPTRIPNQKAYTFGIENVYQLDDPEVLDFVLGLTSPSQKIKLKLNNDVEQFYFDDTYSYQQSALKRTRSTVPSCRTVTSSNDESKLDLSSAGIGFGLGALLTVIFGG